MSAPPILDTHSSWRLNDVLDRPDGKVPMLDAESLLTVEEAATPGTEIGDLVHVDGRIWHVRSALTTAGSTTLQLVTAQRADATVGGEDVAIHLAGDSGVGVPIVALAAAGVLRRSDLLDVDGDAYRVGTPTVWPAGDLRRYALTPA